MKSIFTNFFLAVLLACSSMQAFCQNIISQAENIAAKANVPELAFAVISKDSVLTQGYLGHHNLGHLAKDTARNTDYFHLGSNTKAITGFIAAWLVEQKKISWDTQFFDLFPQWKKQSNPAYYNITLAQLLSHRAGIEPYTGGLEFAELPEFTGSKSAQRLQFVSYLLREKPVEPDDQPYHYSNAGYTIAAAMLEKATGQTWEQLVQNIMNEKLNLNVRFGFPNKTDINQPAGHWIEKAKLTEVPANTNYNLNLAEPAGDISMTLPNYIKFIQLNLKGLYGQQAFLQPATYQYLHFGTEKYSIGWGNGVKEGQKISQHNGSAGTFYVHTSINSTKGVAYIIAVNSATTEAQKAVSDLLKILKERYN